MVQNYDGIAISQLRNTQLEKTSKKKKKMQGMFTKGFLSASLCLVTLPSIVPQHKLDQTKEHVQQIKHI